MKNKNGIKGGKMGKRLMLILACALIVGLALPAFAEVQNVKVSGDITMYGVTRNNFTLGSTIQEADDTGSENASIVRVRLDADLTENVGTTIRLVNERDWSMDAASVSEVSVDLASVTLKEFLYSPLTLTLGRQELHFGGDFIIGDPDRNNSSPATTFYNQDLSSKKAFDAIRATLNYDPLVVDIFWAKINENTIIPAATAATEEKDDIDLYGVNARYDFGGNWKTIGELYYFYKHDDSVRNTANLTNKKTTEVNVVGSRIDITPTARLNLQQEVALEFGRTNTTTTTNPLQPIKAWAAQTIARYDLTDKKLHPVLMGICGFYSGASSDVDQKNTNWDPMYENQTSGHIANVLLDPTNAHVLNLRGSIVPMEDLTVTLDYVYLRLAKGVVGSTALTTYTPNHTTVTNITHTSDGLEYLGSEIDLTLTYDYTEDVQLGLIAGHFDGGDAFDNGSKDTKNASELIASVKVSF